MNIEDWEYLIENCNLAYAADESMIYEPKSDKARDRIEKILKDNKMEHITLSDFKKICQQMRPLFLARKELKKHQFSLMSTQEVAKLPLEQKVEYMELLFPPIVKKDTKEEEEEDWKKVVEVCKKNEANIKACLFSMDFPKSFWEEEKKKADRYVSLIVNDPEITGAMKKWAQTTLEEKKDVIKKAAEVFEYVYGVAPKIDFFTEEERIAENKANGFSENVHINAAESGNGIISFNLDRLQSSDNFFAASVVLHEGTHLRQEKEIFEDPLVERIMKCYTSYSEVYEDRLNNKESLEYKDFYTMQPHEIHAYGLQEYVEDKLIEMTGIEKTANQNNKETRKIHDKAFTMARIAQYRSSEK